MKKNKRCQCGDKYDALYEERGKNPAAREWLQDNIRTIRNSFLTNKEVLIPCANLPRNYPIWRKIGKRLLKAEEILSFELRKEGLLLKRG